jgi:hypothetical protein
MDEFSAKELYSLEFRRCLIELDAKGIMKLWKQVAPHLEQLSSEREALYSLHMARTGAESVPKAMRLYSQRWLNERGLGSFLPENRRGH